MAFLIEIKGVKFIIESDIKGVVMLPFKNWIKEQKVEVWHIWQPEKFDEKMFTKVGYIGYGFTDLFFYMPMYLITKKFKGRTTDTPDNRPTCYEFGAWVLGLIEWYKMTPEKFRSAIGLVSKCQGEIPATYLSNINLITMTQDYKIWWEPQNEQELQSQAPFLQTQNAEFVSASALWPNGYYWVEQSLNLDEFNIIDIAANNHVAIDIKPKPYPPGNPLGR